MEMMIPVIKFLMTLSKTIDWIPEEGAEDKASEVVFSKANSPLQ